jgi:predicted RND superfamily exporter protein
MYWWQIPINPISAICLVMAIGLVIDYLVHPMHFFMLQDVNETPRRRLEEALAEIGPTVCYGIGTTFVGVLPLMFAQSYVFRVFFQMFISIIGFCALHALVLTPTLLIVLNPKKKHEAPPFIITQAI